MERKRSWAGAPRNPHIPLSARLHMTVPQVMNKLSPPMVIRGTAVVLTPTLGIDVWTVERGCPPARPQSCFQGSALFVDGCEGRTTSTTRRRAALRRTAGSRSAPKNQIAAGGRSRGLKTRSG